MNQTTRRKPEKGASQSRTRLSDVFSGYLSHHRWMAADSFQRLIKAPIPSLMTWLVLGIALALPTGLFVSLNNLESLGNNFDGAAQISLFVNRTLSDDAARSLAREIEKQDGVERTEFISRSQALDEFQQLSGYGDILQTLPSNPLPAVIVVYPEERDGSAEAVKTLYQTLAKHPQIEHAVLDLQWVQRLYSLMGLARRMTLALAGLLGFGVLLVIGNTIRLAIESRRDEIVIIKLVGGTNAFVRRPFLYTGLWYGLGGGIAAWLIILMSLWALSGPVSELAGLYASDYRLHGLGFLGTLGLWFGSGLLGLCGAWLAVSRHLGAIEPR